MKRSIEIGDIVKVDINNAQTTLSPKAEVHYVPNSDGDHWHFEDLMTGRIVHTNERCTVTLLDDEPPTQPYTVKKQENEQ